MTHEDEKVLEHHRVTGGGCNHMDKRALLRIIDELTDITMKITRDGAAILLNLDKERAEIFAQLGELGQQRFDLAEALSQRLGQCCPSAGNPDRLTWCKTCVSDDALLAGIRSGRKQ